MIYDILGKKGDVTERKLLIKPITNVYTVYTHGIIMDLYEYLFFAISYLSVRGKMQTLISMEHEKMILSFWKAPLTKKCAVDLVAIRSIWPHMWKTKKKLLKLCISP